MSKLVSPCVGTVTSGYGPRKAPTAGASTFHKGVDLARGPLRVVAPADGRVVASAFTSGRGHYVQIDHGNGVRTLHQHLTGRLVGVGADVAAGQHIGNMGKTGLATGVHLHTEVTVNGANVDPAAWYEERGVTLGTEDEGTLVTAAPPAPAQSGALVLGMKGARVGRLQQGLRTVFPAYRNRVPKPYKGRLIAVDDVFGGQTKAWVIVFQEATGLVPDGIVGPITTAKLAEYGISL